MFSEKLKEQTRQSHQDLERVLIPQIKSIKTKEDYLELLGLFYSYFGALEEKIRAVIDTRSLPDYSQRRKTSSIAGDIAILGGQSPELVSDEQLPQIRDHAEALAALYVIEGSALGGKIISRMISQSLEGRADAALNFYNGYGEQTMDMWNSFKDAMNQQIVSEDQQERAIATATETFVRFKQLALT